MSKSKYGFQRKKKLEKRARNRKRIKSHQQKARVRFEDLPLVEQSRKAHQQPMWIQQRFHQPAPFPMNEEGTLKEWTPIYKEFLSKSSLPAPYPLPRVHTLGYSYGWKKAQVSISKQTGLLRLYHYRSQGMFAEAICAKTDHEGASSPILDCSCGCYAVKDRHELSPLSGSGYAVLSVALSGHIVESSGGYRAQYQQVLGLWFNGLCAGKGCDRKASFLNVAHRGAIYEFCDSCVTHYPGKAFSLKEFANHFDVAVGWLSE